MYTKLQRVKGSREQGEQEVPKVRDKSGLSVAMDEGSCRSRRSRETEHAEMIVPVL